MVGHADEYRFVDTAIGGVNQRNNVADIQTFALNGTRSECYASYMRATDDLATYADTHPNASGRPSVGGYPGKTWTDALRLDFDCEKEPAKALEWLRLMCERLLSMDVDLGAVRFYFSGHKGFHAEIPAQLFGGFEPSESLHRSLKRAAIALMQDIPFDPSIYDKLRLWRLPGSQNGKTKLYKIRLTPQEVLSKDFDWIKKLARGPRDEDVIPDLTPIDDDEWNPIPSLVDIWLDSTRPESETSSSLPPEAPAVEDADRDRLTIGAIASSWPHSHEGISRHTNYLLPLAGFLCGRTSADHALHLITAGAVESNDREFLAPQRPWKTEIERIVQTTVSKQGTDEHISGIHVLASNFAGLAKILEALWPDQSFNIFDGLSAQQIGTEDGPPQATDYELQTLQELVSNTANASDPLIEGIFWKNRITWVFAPSGSGKTLFVLAAALHVAAERVFHHQATENGPVLLIEEDSPLSVLAQYVDDLADIYEIDLASVPLFWINRQQGLRIIDERGLALAKAVVEKCPQKPLIVIIDACERLTPSDRFNSKEFDPLVRFLQWLIAKEITPIVIDHTKKPTTDSKKSDKPTKPLDLLYGAVAKTQICDCMIYFSGSPKTSIRVSFEKFRGETPPPFDVKFSSADGFKLTFQPYAPANEHEHKVMAFFANPQTQGPQTAVQIRDGTHLRERTAYRAIEKLVAHRLLIHDPKTYTYTANSRPPSPFQEPGS